MAQTYHTSASAVLFWQEWEDDAMGEPAIIVTPYSDIVELNQEGRHINISKHEVKSFIKLLHQVLKNS